MKHCFFVRLARGSIFLRSAFYKRGEPESVANHIYSLGGRRRRRSLVFTMICYIKIQFKKGKPIKYFFERVQNLKTFPEDFQEENDQLSNGALQIAYRRNKSIIDSLAPPFFFSFSAAKRGICSLPEIYISSRALLTRRDARRL